MEDRLEGVVKEWNGSYGFIDFLDGRRAYVHTSLCEGVPLMVGQTVTGLLVPDPRNPSKWQAQAVERTVAYAEDDTGRLTGVVTQWNATYGFIQFSDGRRAYVHTSMCGGQALAEGMQVIGLVCEDPQNPGKWQAQQVEIAGGTAASVVGAEGKLQGQVAQWNGSYGFIHFADDRRAYVHTSQCNNESLFEGEVVFANLVEDPRNPGKWQATEVQVQRGPAQRVPAAPAGRFVGGGPVVGAAPAMGGIQGQVSEWNGSYGFAGFGDGRRAYLHTSQCNNASLAVGQTIFAQLVEDPRNPGKWQATNVRFNEARSSATVAPPPFAAQFARAISPHTGHFQPPPAPPNLSRGGAAVSSGGRVDGVVVQWTEKGYGFVELSDGRRAYVHSSFCGGQSLEQGERISAVLVPDSKAPGKWQAQQVVRAQTPTTGVVAEWKVEGGYGFINLDDGRRAYVHRSALGGSGDLSVGSHLSVVVRPDARNPEKWCVEQLLSAPDGGDFSTSPQQVFQQPHAAAFQQILPPSAAEDGGASSCSGVVAEWNPKGFGFINLEDGRRAYVHNSQCGGEHLEAGESVSADIAPDERTPGKWQALNVLRGSATFEEPPGKRLRLT